jgi:hypothetical protein
METNKQETPREKAQRLIKERQQRNDENRKARE